MNDMNEEQFLVHSLLGVDPSISLVKVGELSAEQLKKAASSFTDCEPVGWESVISDADFDLAKKHNFSIETSVADEDFVMFGFSKHEEKKAQLNLLFNLYSDTAHHPFGVLTCDTYFAHIHNDRETTDSAGQIMFVIENEGNHILYSKDENNIEHTLVPKKGDIILLDVWCDHAVIPNQSNGIEFMRQNGMKLVCFALD